MKNVNLVDLADLAGIVFPGAIGLLPRHEIREGDWGEVSVGMDAAFRMAHDAQPAMVTTPNSAIPAFLTTYIDPKLVQVLTTPNKASEIYGEVKIGDWLMETAMFPMVESTGEVSSYGDFSENGRANANFQYENRQSYLFQTFTEWGERELERAGLGRIDWAARLNIASALTLNKAANFYAFYGVAGLQNYGALNDPSLPAALTPTTKAAGGTSWSVALPTEILADVQKMFAQLQVQTGSNLELDMKMTLAMHSVSETYLANTNSFGLTAAEMIKKVFPGLRIIQAPQFLSGTTYTCQMFVDELEGTRTFDVAFNEKMRAHAVIQAASSWKQKKTSGVWGAIVRFPAGVVSMAGI